MKRDLRLFYVLACSVLLQAQPVEVSAQPIHQLGLGLSLGQLQLRDEVLVRTRFDGVQFGLDLTYDAESARGHHAALLQPGMSLLSNRYDARMIALTLNLAYAYGHTIARFSASRVALGGQVSWRMLEYYSESWDEEHLYWLNAYELGPYLRWDRALNAKHRLAASFTTAWIDLTSRPPRQRFYKIDKLTQPGFFFSKPHSELTVTSVHEYLSFAARIDHMRSFSARFALGSALSVGYVRHSQPEPIQALTFLLHVRALIKSGREASP